jgi:hypothetical protein
VIIDFNAQEHTYTLDGTSVLSVTQIMDGLLTDYSKVPKQYLEKAAARGTAVHRAAELYQQNDLDESSLHPEVAPYFYQFVKWVKESRFEPFAIEIRVGSTKYGYAGTLDIAGRLPRMKSNAIIDIKTTSMLMPSTGPQTAAYETGYKETTGCKKKYRRFALWLRPEFYKLIPLENGADFSTFLSCLAIKKWNEANK